ncbi:MAG: beta-galactosidase [Planctomycetota bacterium]
MGKVRRYGFRGERIRRRGWLLFGLFLAFLGPSVSSGEEESPGKNLLTNAGFEEGKFTPEGLPTGWYRMGERGNATLRWREDQGRGGGKCVTLADARARAGLAHVRIPVSGTKTYYLSGWVRTRGLGNAKIWIRVAFGGKGISTQHFVIRCRASEAWKHHTLLITGIPAAAEMAVVMIQIREGAAGEAWVDDLYFGETVRPPFKSPYPVPTLSGERPKGKRKATGFFRTEKIDGVWWLINPEGELFWSVGACCTGGGNPVLQKNQLEPMQDKKGAMLAFIRQSMERAAEWGFNSLGAWSSLDWHGFELRKWNAARREKGEIPLAYFLTFNSSNAGLSDREAMRRGFFLVDTAGLPQGGTRAQGHRMCDPFNPEWQRALEEYFQRKIAPYRDDPDCIGIFLDNEISIFNLSQFLWSPHALEAFVAHLKFKHHSAEKLNSAWSTKKAVCTYSEISSSALRKNPPGMGRGSQAMDRDLQEFETILVKAYVKAIVSAARRVDSNHLLIGNRWGTGHEEFVPYVRHFMAAFSAFDICAANLYPHPEEGSWVADFNSRKQLGWIKALHEMTGKPILIGEFGTASRDSGVPVQRWRARTLDTDEQRGESYKKMVYTYYSLPFVVGAHWFRWSNGYGFGNQLMRDPRSCGLIDDWNKPYEKIVAAIRETHEKIGKHGRRGDCTLDDLPLPGK